MLYDSDDNYVLESSNSPSRMKEVIELTDDDERDDVKVSGADNLIEKHRVRKVIDKLFIGFRLLKEQLPKTSLKMLSRLLFV